MQFADAAAIVTPPDYQRTARRRLERLLDGHIEAHREVTREHLSVTRDEMDADINQLLDLGRTIGRAARATALRFNRIADNNISPRDASELQTAREIAERFEESLDGLLRPSAARVLGAAISLEMTS